MGSGFGDFIGQPFVSALLGMVCFFAILLMATVGALVFVRRQRAQKAQLQTVAAGFDQTPPSLYDADMPDLSLLVTAPPPPTPAPAPQAAPVPTAAPIRVARKGTFSITPLNGGQTEAVEVMTLLRDVTDGRLIVQMGDKAYQNGSMDAEFNERFSKLIRELGQIMTKPAMAAASTALSDSAPVEDSEVTTTLADVSQTAEPAFLKPKAPAPVVQSSPFDGKMPGDLPSYKLDDNPMPRLKRGQKANLEPVPEVNIAGAIEAYLQHKLRQTGDFAGRSIHIYPAPDGGVSIEVDGRYFEAVGDVADSAVREFLAQTIQEWQERH